MKPPVPMKQNSVKVAEVVVRDRLRPVSQAGVDALLASIAETGIMKDAIHVRKMRNGELRLMAGAHRLAAATELGWEEIEAKIFADVTDDWARLIEIDDNLAGAEMNPLDTAVFLATRKAIYERLNPETKHRTFRGNQHQIEVNELSSFTTTAAEKLGITVRQVQKMVAAGSRLGPDEIRQLRLAPRAVTLADLQEIGKIGEAPERYAVVRMLATGEAKGAAKARKAYLHRDNPPVPVDPVEAEFIAMRKLWDRAHKAARIRFVETARKEILALLPSVEGGEDD